MSYRYFMCDVFTDRRFGGNQLAVLPEAEGLSDQQMQQIAREFNFSESTFVLPAEQGHTRRGRIFTPTMEVPFAAHPNVGTAFGLPFVIAEVKDRAALERARANMAGADAILAAGVTPDIHLYIRSADEFDLRARMFAPLDGVPEDPATGSANCALVGLLSHNEERADGSFRWRIAQGVEMKRPSVLEARTEK